MQTPSIHRGALGTSGGPITAYVGQIQRAYPALRLNLLTGRIEFGPYDRPQRLEWLNSLYLRIGTYDGQPPSRQLAIDLVYVIAFENRFHPIRRGLSHCAGQVAPSTFFPHMASELLGLRHDAALNPRFRHGANKDRLIADVILERFLISAVRRVARPGCSLDWMPVFVRDQRADIVDWLAILAGMSEGQASAGMPAAQWLPRYPLTQPPEPPDHGFGIFHLPQQGRSWRPCQHQQLAYLGQRVDSLDTPNPYAKELPRSWVPCGVAHVQMPRTNSQSFALLPVPVKGTVKDPRKPGSPLLDLQRLEQERDGLWSAAVAAYRAGQPSSFSPDELDAIRASFRRIKRPRG